MRSLIVEDDFVSRKLLHTILAPYSRCHMAVNGKEAVYAFKAALEAGAPYKLICMDILMPELNGQEALKQIRTLERLHGVSANDEAKIVMITVLDDPQNVVEAYYKGGATSYVPKPVDKKLFLKLLHNIGVL